MTNKDYEIKILNEAVDKLQEELNTRDRAISAIASAIPLNDFLKATMSFRDMIDYFKFIVEENTKLKKERQENDLKIHELYKTINRLEDQLKQDVEEQEK